MKKLLFSTFVCAITILVIAALLPAQTPQKGSGPGASKAQAPKVTYQGKIEFMKTLGGYFLKTENPVQEMIIVNPNPKVLEQLQKSGKKIAVKGHLTGGAEHLFIESIDGKAYKAAKKPAPK